MHILFCLELQVELEGRRSILRIPTPSDWYYLRLTLCSIYLCTGSEKVSCPVVGSTVVDLSVAVRMFTRTITP